MVFVWYGLALTSTMFYASNLRAHLVATELEGNIDTTQDVILNGRRVWIHKSEVRMKYGLICSTILSSFLTQSYSSKLAIFGKHWPERHTALQSGPVGLNERRLL